MFNKDEVQSSVTLFNLFESPHSLFFLHAFDWSAMAPTLPEFNCLLIYFVDMMHICYVHPMRYSSFYFVVVLTISFLFSTILFRMYSIKMIIFPFMWCFSSIVICCCCYCFFSVIVHETKMCSDRWLEKFHYKDSLKHVRYCIHIHFTTASDPLRSSSLSSVLFFLRSSHSHRFFRCSRFLCWCFFVFDVLFRTEFECALQN